MADQKLTDMTEITSIDPADYIYVVRDLGGGNYASRKLSLNNFASLRQLAIGSNGNTVDIDDEGNLLLTGNATCWDDLRIPLESTKLGGSKEPSFEVAFTNGLGSQGVFAYHFSATTEQELFFSVQLPHRWKQGSDIHAHIHWFPKTTGGVGQKVNWGLEYTWASLLDTFGNSTIISNNTEIRNGPNLVANKHLLTPIGTINGSGQTFSSMLLCRLFRDATGALGTDNYADDAVALEFDFHYQVDSFGSVDEYVKYEESSSSSSSE